MEKKHKFLTEFIFRIKHGGKYINQWDLKRFTNIYLT